MVCENIDDVIIFSKDESQHNYHLNIVFQKLQGTRLTLRGKKCHIGMHNVFYRGHTFSGAGMMPYPGKVKVVEEWPTPQVHSVRQFLGLASYYRRYVNAFAAIAAPLHFLTQKDAPFNWTTECDAAFQTLKQILCRPQYRLTLGLTKMQVLLFCKLMRVPLDLGQYLNSWSCHCIRQPKPQQIRAAIQCNTDGMLSCGIGSETISTLLIGSPLQHYNRSCTTSMVVSSENGRFIVPLGIANTSM